MADAPDYWRVGYRHGPVVGWAVSRGRSPVRCPCCMCGCGSLAGVVFETVTTTIGGIFDTMVPGVPWVAAAELAPHPADQTQRRFIVMRKDNAIASSDVSGTPQQPTQADPAESALERYLAVIADADKSSPPAQHSAQGGPNVVSEVMTVGVVSAHGHDRGHDIGTALSGVLSRWRRLVGIGYHGQVPFERRFCWVCLCRLLRGAAHITTGDGIVFSHHNESPLCLVCRVWCQLSSRYPGHPRHHGVKDATDGSRDSLKHDTREGSAAAHAARADDR